MAHTTAESAGELLGLVRSGDALTRADLARVTGLSRSTITQRIDTLLAADLVYEAGEAASSGGRPPRTLAFNAAAGVVLVADLGATHSRLAIADLGGSILGETSGDLDISRGPDEVMAWVIAQFADLLESADRPPGQVRGVGIGLPGPVEYSVGRAVHPPIMPGWDGVKVPDLVQLVHPVPVLVDNDVNIMALGEYWTHWRDRVDDLLFVKVGTGVGSGIVAGGRIHRGQNGAAGDLGHVRVPSAADAPCRCGNLGCLEAVASGAALASQMRDLGVPARDARDVAASAMAGDATANRLVRSAGRLIGEVLAGAVNLLNPGAIVLGGDVSLAANQLVAGVRERIYERSTVLATHDLRIARSELGDRAGVVGAAVMILESILVPTAVDTMLEARSAGS
ncbi:MAG TPA: ROK family transcriptional regulator [Nitriliruptoraceae bacterium]|nr:ROK family transcriptional regulator [Nitriliruptoraceae bacterium]